MMFWIVLYKEYITYDAKLEWQVESPGLWVEGEQLLESHSESSSALRAVNTDIHSLSHLMGP